MSDYIPCIFWGDNAVISSQWKIGMNISIFGRMESRIYYKSIDNIKEKKTAYEVSVSKLKDVEEGTDISDFLYKGGATQLCNIC